MNDTRADKKALIGLDELSLSYNYQFSRSITKRRGKYSKIYDNENYYNKTFKPFELVSFDYNGIKFNMITCPAGGKVNIESGGEQASIQQNIINSLLGIKVNIESWGEQEIKEPFMLGETEVSQELFEAVMGFNYSNFKDSNKNPVEQVSWYDCLEFCNRLSGYLGFDNCYMLNNKEYTNSEYPLSIEKAEYTLMEGADGFRLPKEWEWQIAAMAGTNNQYAGANDDESLKRVAWLYKNSGEKTHAVAQKKPNEWGFYDMSGNVWEWCENSITPDKNIDPSAGRVDRGGGWFNEASDLRSAKRDYFSASDRYDGIGFRVARSI